jgi:hypothetical protein
LRSKLRDLRINHSRILDIHYPDRHIVALLVHNDYADELRDHFIKCRVTPSDEFDPCDPKVVRDPAHASKTEEERTEIAHRLHCDRMSRAIQFIRPPVRFAVARFFHKQHWITDQELEETLSTNKEDPAEIFRRPEDDNMSLASQPNSHHTDEL